MGLREQQRFLAALYTSGELRSEFVGRPDATGRRFGLDASEIEEILEIYQEEIEAFAVSLFHKRLREVAAILPLTTKHLGDRFEGTFREFTEGFNSGKVNKHLADAVGFAQYLRASAGGSSWLKDIAGLELARLEFGPLEKRLVVRRFAHDVRSVTLDKLPGSPPVRRTTYGIWLRFGRGRRHFFI